MTSPAIRTAGRPRRGAALTTFAVLFALLAVSNFLKPFRLGGEQTGFVLLGRRLSGTANAVAGPLFGAFLLAYAAAIWRMRSVALAMARAYALYVVVNLLLFNVRSAQPPGAAYLLFGVVYAAVAIGVSGGAAYLLARRRAELG
jgi:hypothetical protein